MGRGGRNKRLSTKEILFKGNLVSSKTIYLDKQQKALQNLLNDLIESVDNKIESQPGNKKLPSLKDELETYLRQIEENDSVNIWRTIAELDEFFFSKFLKNPLFAKNSLAQRKIKKHIIPLLDKNISFEILGSHGEKRSTVVVFDDDLVCSTEFIQKSFRQMEPSYPDYEWTLIQKLQRKGLVLIQFSSDQEPWEELNQAIYKEAIKNGEKAHLVWRPEHETVGAYILLGGK